MTASMLETLQIESPSCIALIGAGGKTTTMYALADTLAAAGTRTLLTTTTKIRPPSHLPLILEAEEKDTEKALERALRESPVVALGHHVSEYGKLHGVRPEVVCQLFANRLVDVVLCEADGAGGKSIKGYREGEPVIPFCSTTVLVLVGLTALGAPVREVVHRPELLCERLGVLPATALEPDHVAKALLWASSFAPNLATVVYILNQADTHDGLSRGLEVTKTIRDEDRSARVVMTKRGSPVQVRSASLQTT